MNRVWLFTLLLLSVACQNDEKEPDSVEMAKDMNRSMDSARSNDPVSLAADHNFLVEAYSGTKMEIELGQHAATHAVSPAVKQFGQMMVNDHRKSDSAITLIAQVKAINVPSVPGNDHQKIIDEMKKTKTADFDKAYMKHMVEDHEADIEKFEEAASNAKDEDIRQFAAGALPALRKHLEAAKKIRDQLK